MLLQDAEQGSEVRPVGDGGADVVIVVKDGEPGAHSFGDFPDQAGIHPVLPEPEQHVLPGAVGLHQGEEDRIQAEVSQVLGDVAADAAVHIADLPGVPAPGDIGAGRITLDIHKDGTDDHDAHRPAPYDS